MLSASGGSSGGGGPEPENAVYVRDGASGSADGSDWTNAYTDLPSALDRGSTYYVADGSYAGYTFNDAADGTTLITVKKATVADHGTDTGWQDTYGDGQAVFGQSTITTSYLVIDGATRDEADWFDGTAYGIKFTVGASGQNIVFTNSHAWSNVTLQYLHLEGQTSTTTPGLRPYNIDMGESNSNGARSGLVISRVYAQYGSNNFFVRSTTGAIIEYSASDGGWSEEIYHGEIVNAYYNVEAIIVRWNWFRNASGQTATIAVASTADSGNNPSGEAYGNIFENCDTTDAMIGFGGSVNSDADGTGWKVYNNTIVKSGLFSSSAGLGFGDGSGNESRNNLWVGSGNPSISLGSGGTNTHNAYSGTTSGTDAQGSVATSIFTDYAGGDYSLASNTTAGVDLGAPYNVDMFGNTRTTWSRGALEYQA